MHIIERLANWSVDRRTVAGIERKIIKQSERNAVSRLFHSKHDKEDIAAWKLGLNEILHIFNVCSISPSRWLLMVLHSDRTGDKYPRDCCRYASQRFGKSENRQLGERDFLFVVP